MSSTTQIRRVELSDGELTERDIIDFLDEIAPQFGTRRLALAFVLRSAGSFELWRQWVEYCSFCKHFVRIVPHPDMVQTGDELLIKYSKHEYPDRPDRCPGSGSTGRWNGTPFDEPPASPPQAKETTP